MIRCARRISARVNSLRWNRSIRTYYDLFDLVRERPEMYLGEKALTRLDMYLRGYGHGSGGLRYGNPNFSHFYDFVAAIYREPATKGWSRIILENTHGDEERAVDVFYRLLDRFRKLEAAVVWQSNCERKLRRTGRVYASILRGGKVVRVRSPIPSKIEVLKYPVHRMPVYLVYTSRDQCREQKSFDSLREAIEHVHLEFEHVPEGTFSQSKHREIVDP